MPHELPKQRQHPAWAVPAKASLSAAKQAVSARQLLEQGMHGLQGSLLRLKDHFIYEETSKRKLALQSAMRRLCTISAHHLMLCALSR